MSDNSNYCKSLVIVFSIHMVMFFGVLAAGIYANSSALLADSLDFIGDAANYALTFYVMSRGVVMRASAAMLKAVTMLAFGVPMLIYALSQYSGEVVPNSEVMNASGLLGLSAHLICVYYLYKFRKGDSNLLSVWVCTINDLISNVLIVIGAYLVHTTNSIVPDIVVAIIIVAIALIGACIIFARALNEIKAFRLNKLQELKI
ncbi:MAG: cation transporter [Rickettsiales bacterium]